MKDLLTHPLTIAAIVLLAYIGGRRFPTLIPKIPILG